MYRPYYSKHNPPPRYYHPCGQPLDVEEGTVGYCTRLVYVVDEQIVSHCPRCGKRIWFDGLVHPDAMPKRGEATWGDYLDYQDMIRDLGPVL
jgi:hypothetical protein